MMRLLFPLIALLLASNAALAQGRWLFSPDGGEGAKFGYVAQPGSNNFSPLWIYCAADTRQVVVTAYVGERRPNDGRGSFTLTAPGEPAVTVAGEVAPEAFDGLYTLAARIARGDPLLALLARAQPMAYTGGTIRANLAANGLPEATRKLRASLSKRVATRRKCLSLQKKRSTRLRWR